MKTQSNRSNAALKSGATSISITGRSAQMQATPLPMGRTDPQNHSAEYNGYRLIALARPANTELYAADLVIGLPGFPSRHFRALDYFYDARQALHYAIRWGRIWTDHQLEKTAGNANRLDDRAGQS